MSSRVVPPRNLRKLADGSRIGSRRRTVSVWLLYVLMGGCFVQAIGCAQIRSPGRLRRVYCDRNTYSRHAIIYEKQDHRLYPSKQVEHFRWMYGADAVSSISPAVPISETVVITSPTDSEPTIPHPIDELFAEPEPESAPLPPPAPPVLDSDPSPVESMVTPDESHRLMKPEPVGPESPIEPEPSPVVPRPSEMLSPPTSPPPTISPDVASRSDRVRLGGRIVPIRERHPGLVPLSRTDGAVRTPIGHRNPPIRVRLLAPIPSGSATDD